MNTHGLKIDFGKHKGQLWTRVPVGYLRWLVNVKDPLTPEAIEIANAELDRRGSKIPTIEISGHAIDRASLRCRKIWHEDRTKDEGLHSWLVRVSKEALERGERAEEKIKHKGMKFVFEHGEYYPSLKTIMRDKISQPEKNLTNEKVVE